MSRRSLTAPASHKRVRTIIAKAIQTKLPGAQVVTTKALADQVSGSLADTKKLSDRLGGALAVIVLIAAFGLASLLTLSSVAKRVDIPISGIGGIGNWRDAVEFMLLGSTSVQVCTAAMHYGFRIVRDMIDGLENYLEEKGLNSAMELVGKSVPRIEDWGNLDLNYKIIARIDAEKCIGCNLCYIACEDGAHQCIRVEERPYGDLRHGDLPKHVPRILEDECVGCNLCALVCPVPNCISMVEVSNGRPAMSWKQLQEARGRSPQCSNEELLAGRKEAGS